MVAILDSDALYASYLKTGSVHKTGEEFGVCGETVRQHLMRAKKRLNASKWTEMEVAAVRTAYSDPDGVNLAILANQISRTYAGIACKAEELKLTGRRGTHARSPMARHNMSAAQKTRAERPKEKLRRSGLFIARHTEKGHPRGMLGKHHTPETKAAIASFHRGKPVPRERVDRTLKTKYERYGCIAPNVRRGSWRAAWVELDGKRLFARSLWEANYAHYLNFLKGRGEIKEWEHEPHTFWFEKIRRGVRSYLPDFRVTLSSGVIEWHEVKGWMDARSKTKIKRMAKYYPDEVLCVRDGAWFRTANAQFTGVVPGWETIARPKAKKSSP